MLYNLQVSDRDEDLKKNVSIFALAIKRDHLTQVSRIEEILDSSVVSFPPFFLFRPLRDRILKSIVPELR